MRSRKRTGAVLFALVILMASACRASFPNRLRIHPGGKTGPRILVVVAHPDDEISFAGTLYATARFLDGACDVAVVTNGEGGFKYATLAESIYGHELTEETVGREHLPDIRRRELRAGCEILGVRDLYFFEQKDHRYTTELAEVLGANAEVWELPRLRAALKSLLENGAYDFVFTLAPTPSTHAHHQAASLLALEAAWSLPEERRPVVLCTEPRDGVRPPAQPALPGLPATGTSDHGLAFDRTRKFGHRERLDYRIVVNWAIAEHKSQGTMQLLMNRGDREAYLLFDGNPPGSAERAQALFQSLQEPRFPKRVYAPTAGTNAGTR